MAKYYGLMLDTLGTIRGIRALDGPDDLAALESARLALLSLSQYDVAEVWHRSTRVGTVVRATTHTPQAGDTAAGVFAGATPAEGGA
jgi:hypothetical protein